MNHSEAEKELIEERAAFMEVDGGLSREEAEKLAEENFATLKKATQEKKVDIEEIEPIQESEELKINNRFLNIWNDSISRATDAPRELVLFAGIGLLSALCHRFYFYAARPTYLNLFLFILGPSSSSRKTTVLDMVLDYVGEVDPDLVLPNEFTPEALFTCLSKKNHGIIFSRELNLWLDQMLGKDYNRGLGSTLGNIYDHAKCLTRETKKDGLITITDPVVTILGAGVDEYLIEHLKEIDLISGFWPRVTLVRLPPQATKGYKAPGRFLLEPHILEKLHTISAKEGGEIRYEKIEPLREAYACNLYQEAAEIRNNNLAAGYARLEWILIKIAALLELADNPGSKEIEIEAFDDAVKFVNYIKRQLPEFYGEHTKPDQETKLAEWAFDFIKKRDKGGTVFVPYRIILQCSHTATGKLKAALGRLLDAEQVEQSDIPATKLGGRPGKGYRSTKSDE
jgi:hypothetical protein